MEQKDASFSGGRTQEWKMREDAEKYSGEGSLPHNISGL